MKNIVQKTLQTYISEKRIPSQSDFLSEDLAFMASKNAIFVTLFLNNSVIASQGRIQPQKENSFMECIDVSLQCLRDPRFSVYANDVNLLNQIKIRVDAISQNSRRILSNIQELQPDEGIIFLAQNRGKMSVILPNMIIDNPTPEKYLDLAKQKAGVETNIPE